MAIVKNKTTENNREFWSHIEQVTKQVNTWPEWMRNEPVVNTDQERNSQTENDESKRSAA
jgi:hypothetical protein